MSINETDKEKPYLLQDLMTDLGLTMEKKYQALYKQILDTLGVGDDQVARPAAFTVLPANKEACFKILQALPPYVRVAYRPEGELQMMEVVYKHLYGIEKEKGETNETRELLQAIEKAIELLSEPISEDVFENAKTTINMLSVRVDELSKASRKLIEAFKPQMRYFVELAKFTELKKEAEKQIENLEKSRLTFLAKPVAEKPKEKPAQPLTVNFQHQVLQALPESWGKELENITTSLPDQFATLLVSSIKTINTITWRQLGNKVEKAQLPSIQSYLANRVLDRVAVNLPDIELSYEEAIATTEEALKKEIKSLDVDELLLPYSVDEFISLVPSGYFDLGAYLVRYGLHHLRNGGEAIDISRSASYIDFKKAHPNSEFYNAFGFDSLTWSVKKWGSFFREFGLAHDFSQPKLVSIARSVFAKEMSARMLGFKRS